MYEAARLHDPIAHSSALAGFLIGAIIGIAIIAAVAFSTVTCGFGAALIAGLAAGFAAQGVLSLGESIGRAIKTNAGTIAIGSPNVFVNNRNAAHVEFSSVSCDKHPPVKRIAEGSGSVFINDKAAARKEDRTECDATVDAGSDDVFIGGGTVQYLKIDPEIPDWLRTAVQVAFIVAGLAGSMAGAAHEMAEAGGQFGIRCATRFVAGFAAGMAASEAVNHYVIGPAMHALMGHPVDVISGRKVILPETDFVLPARLPVSASRFYSSTLQDAGMLGPGWRLDWEITLARANDALIYTGPQGRTIRFPLLEPGHQLYNHEEQIYLSRAHDGRFVVHTLSHHYFVLGDFDDENVARLVLIEGPEGQHIVLKRDKAGRLDEVEAHGGYHLKLHYHHALARLSHVELLAGGTQGVLVRYGYDPEGYLAAVTDRAGTVTRRFAYRNGLMVRQENAEGFECTYGWDIIGDRHCVVEHRSSGGEHYRFRYDFANGQSEATDTFGNVARWQYNAREEVTAHTGFDGREYRFEYDRSGWPNVLHLPGSRRVRLEYDELGRLVSQTDPLGQTTRLDYHANTHHVRRAALDDGREWRTSYDTRHRPTGTVDPCGRRTVLQYADDGQLAQITDARGGPVVLEHDVRGLLTSRTDCSGQTTRYGYDADGRLEAVTNALGQTTRVSYAPDGLPESVTRADLQVEKYKWSALGHLVEHISPAGHIERWERDGLGRVLGFTDAQGRRVRYERDAHGRPLRLVNGNGASYRFEWDPVGRLIAEQRVDGTSRRMGYSESGFLQHIVSQGGASQREEIHERDALGRLLQREGEHSRTHYRYDRLGQLTEARRIPTTAGEMLDILADTVTLKYDETGRLLAEQGVHGSVRYERDVPGNPLSVVLPDGQRIDTLYYGSGHTHRIQVNGHAVADFERDNLHREIRRTQGDLVLHTGYTPMGQIAWQRASALPAGDEHAPSEAESALWWRYRYDSRGEMIESLDRLHGRTVYDYDRAGQLQMRSAEGFDVERFTWDAAGNLLDESTRTPDSRIPPLMDNLLRRYHGVRYAHDVWGQVIQRNGTTLQWDAEGHLLSTLTDQHRATYRYDALGRRTAKRVEQISMPGLMPGRQARETRFVWEGLRLAQERESSGDIRTYVYDPVRAYAPLARVDRSNGSSRDKVCYYHTDPAGTARQVTDSKGHVVWSGACTAWGKVRANLADAANFVQPLRLPGQYQDDESGLHYNLHRYYDPDSGRFISQDPIGLNGGFNLYQYAPNPISWIDPWGLSCESETSASASKFPSRNAAFKAAKRDAGIPMRQQPNRVDLVNLTDRSGKNILGENYQPIKTREYTFNREDGSQIVIQDHWPGHSYGPAGTSGNQGPHINVRPIEDTRNGTVPGTLEHYPF